jgi:hypothetical protein
MHRGDLLQTCQELGLEAPQLRRILDADAKLAQEFSGISRSFDPTPQQSFLYEFRNTRDLFSACRVSGIPRELAYQRRYDTPWFQREWSRIEEVWERRLAERGAPVETYLDREIIEGVFAISSRIRDSHASERAVSAFTSLYGMSAEWILRGHLMSKFGIPPTSVEADFLEWNPPRGKRGGHATGGGVEYARSYLITFVIHRWEPKGPVKDRRT